jgi:hypothetical protein
MGGTVAKKRKLFVIALLAAVASVISKVVKGRRSQQDLGWDAPPATPPSSSPGDSSV